jgi:hypothetical protein
LIHPTDRRHPVHDAHPPRAAEGTHRHWSTERGFPPAL